MDYVEVDRSLAKGWIKMLSFPAPYYHHGTIVNMAAGTSVAHIHGKVDALFGIPLEKKPYRGNILGNVKIRYRNDDFAKVYIRDPIRIRAFILKDMGDHVTHGMEIAQNQRTTPRTSPNET